MPVEGNVGVIIKIHEIDLGTCIDRINLAENHNGKTKITDTTPTVPVQSSGPNQWTKGPLCN